jgi:hypothetical protein
MIAIVVLEKRVAVPICLQNEHSGVFFLVESKRIEPLSKFVAETLDNFTTQLLSCTIQIAVYYLNKPGSGLTFFYKNGLPNTT